jgi:hypothetical protein
MRTFAEIESLLLAEEELSVVLIRNYLENGSKDLTDLDVLYYLLNKLLEIFEEDKHNFFFTEYDLEQLFIYLEILFKKENVDYKFNFNSITSARNWEGYSNYYFETIFGCFQSQISMVQNLRKNIYVKQLVVPIIATDYRDSWIEVSALQNELRNNFGAAKTELEFNQIGLLCVKIMETVSYILLAKMDTSDIENLPKKHQTKKIFDKFIQESLIKSNSELKGLCKKAIGVAHKVKHDELVLSTHTRLQAGIVAESTLLLCSIINLIYYNRKKI